MADIEGQAPAAPGHYVWWFPGAPVRIHLALDVIHGLKKQLRALDPKRTGQGLLFGSTAEGVTEVLDFQVVTGTIPETVGELAKEGSNRLLVGYYRIETSSSLRLNEKDLSLAGAAFTQPYHVFLIIQAIEFGPPSASFFFNGRDGKMSEVSLMEFPLEPSLLVNEERGVRKETGARRSTTLQQPVAVQPPMHEAPALLPNRESRRWRVLLGSLAFAAAVGGGAAIWARGLIPEWWARIYEGLNSPPGRSSVQTLPVLSMGLHARREGADVNITWNRDSLTTAGATSGILTIEDGGVKRDIVLDEAKMHHSNSVLYVPSSEQVYIQLSVTNTVSTVTESVTVILPSDKPKLLAPAAPDGLADRLVPSSARAADTSIRPDSLPVLLVRPALPQRPADATDEDRVPYYAAEPLKRVVPQLPAAMLLLIAAPMKIPVRVAIDQDGRVTQAEATSNFGLQKPILDKLLDAARSWTFKPARRGSDPVSSELVLEFIFRR